MFNQKGAIPLPILVALIGIFVFSAITFTLPFKDDLLGSFFPKDSSFAKSPFNDGDTDGDLDVDLFDYNNILTNFGKGFNNGDYNDNGNVDIFDLNLVLTNFQKKYPANPSSSPVASPPLAMVEGVPVCTDHNSTKWHPLVKKDALGTILCTYGHEHHTDPNTANDLFGPPSAWYGGNQDISYPWQTFSFITPAGVALPTPPTPTNPALLENNLKHEGYKWLVYKDMPCKPAQTADQGCVTSVRVQMHTLGTAGDVPVRFHSYSMEAVIEYKGQRGTIQHGGWMDFGHLGLNVNGGNIMICPNLATNPPTYSCQKGPARTHSSANTPSPNVDHYSYMTSWYGAHEITQFSTTFEEWGPVDYTNPSNQLYFPPTRSANNSHTHLGNMGIQTNRDWMRKYTVNGIVNFNGYTDRHAKGEVTGCTAPSVDCVPLVIKSAPFVHTTWNAGIQGGDFTSGEWDVKSPVTGKSLITFPN